MLANGMGGLDWAGLQLAVAMFGITDIEGLIDRLLVIKSHKPPEQRDPPPPTDTEP